VLSFDACRSQSDLEANLFKVKTELLQMENFIVNG
jgi:hypothetical protein